MNNFTNDEAALAIAGDTADVTAEMIRYVREGRHTDAAPFEIDVVARIAGALRLVLDVEEPSNYLDGGEKELLADLRLDLDRFIAGWVG